MLAISICIADCKLLLSNVPNTRLLCIIDVGEQVTHTKVMEHINKSLHSVCPSCWLWWQTSMPLYKLHGITLCDPQGLVCQFAVHHLFFTELCIPGVVKVIASEISWHVFIFSFLSRLLEICFLGLLYFMLVGVPRRYRVDPWTRVFHQCVYSVCSCIFACFYFHEYLLKQLQLTFLLFLTFCPVTF